MILMGSFCGDDGQEIAHEHGETAVATEGDDLSVRKCHLRADGVGHGVGHRAVIERSHYSLPATQPQELRRPHDAHAGIRDND